jgi:hypothetical protein
MPMFIDKEETERKELSKVNTSLTEPSIYDDLDDD